MSVHLIHGIIDDWQKTKQSHKLYVSRKNFETYLKQRATPYKKWRSGAGYSADHLTIDDSTVAGYDACLSARSLGHEVIIFINPWQIITGEIYFINLLDFYIDNRFTQSISFKGEAYDLSTEAAARGFRNAVKADLKYLSASEAVGITENIGLKLEVTDKNISHYLKPLTIGNIKELQEAGVQIESHGWSHVEISALTEKELVEDLTKTFSWLKEEFKINSTNYAVPFGLTKIPANILQFIEGDYFLADNSEAAGKLSEKCWNRIDISNLIKTDQYTVR